jgi:hypothetical protein
MAVKMLVVHGSSTEKQLAKAEKRSASINPIFKKRGAKVVEKKTILESPSKSAVSTAYKRV